MSDLKFYRCAKCGNIDVHVQESGVAVECCGQPMDLLIPNSVEARHDIHVPLVNLFEGEALVSVGENPHPMLPEHHLQWIAFQSTAGIQIHWLKTEDPPYYEFLIQEAADPLAAYAYCNLHGLWKTRFI